MRLALLLLVFAAPAFAGRRASLSFNPGTFAYVHVSNAGATPQTDRGAVVATVVSQLFTAGGDSYMTLPINGGRPF